MGCIPYQESLLVFDTVYFCVAGNFEVGVNSVVRAEKCPFKRFLIIARAPWSWGWYLKLLWNAGVEIFYEVSVSQIALKCVGWDICKLSNILKGAVYGDLRYFMKSPYPKCFEMRGLRYFTKSPYLKCFEMKIWGGFKEANVSLIARILDLGCSVSKHLKLLILGGWWR